MKETVYKIVYIITDLESGGAEMMLYRLLKRLDRQLYKPYVISLLGIKGSLGKKIRDTGVPVYSIDMKNKLDICALCKLYQIIGNISPTIVHTQLYAADILGRFISRLQRVPVVITSIRNIYYGGCLRNLAIKWTNKFSDRITIVSQTAANKFIETSVIPESKLQIVYNGLDPDSFVYRLNPYEKRTKRGELGLPKDVFLFLSVASLTPQKGYSVMLKAFSLIVKEYTDAFLIIAGTGPLAMRLKGLVKDLDLENKVVFLGNCDNVPDLMASADVLVLSSLWEGLPGVILEAMASELPVVATAVGGTPELVQNGLTGFLVPPNSPGELAKALTKVMMLTMEERYTMGRTARNLVIDNFHVDKMVKAYEDLYFECLQEKNLL